MITRAKSLLIIIGDHKTLCTDDSWKKLFDFCSANDAILMNGKKMHKRIEF